MELFHEVKNRYFHIIFESLNSASKGICREEILKIIDGGEYEEKVIGKDFKSFQGLVLNEYEESENFNLLHEKSGKLYPALKNNTTVPLPSRLTYLEKVWLKNLLENDTASTLLGDNLTEKLKQELINIEGPVTNNMIEMTNKIQCDEVIEMKNHEEQLKTCLKAIMDEKPIEYSDVDKYGNKYENKRSLPIRIEYSLKDERFRISMYSLDENRPIMVNLHTISDLKIIENIESDMSRDKALKLIKENKYSSEPIVMEVVDKKTAIERCFMSFSRMERTSKYLGDNKYEIKLYYYTFEEDDVIRKILELGPYVKVLSPSKIVEKIIEQIRKAIELNSLL